MLEERTADIRSDDAASLSVWMRTLTTAKKQAIASLLADAKLVAEDCWHELEMATLLV